MQWVHRTMSTHFPFNLFTQTRALYIISTSCRLENLNTYVHVLVSLWLITITLVCFYSTSYCLNNLNGKFSMFILLNKQQRLSMKVGLQVHKLCLDIYHFWNIYVYQLSDLTELLVNTKYDRKLFYYLRHTASTLVCFVDLQSCANVSCCLPNVSIITTWLFTF